MSDSDLATRTPDTASERPDNKASRAGWRGLVRWEAGLVVILVAVLIFGTAESSTFMTRATLFFLGINIGYIAIMALPMTLVVITGEIDLSVASMAGMSGAVVGELWHHGWGIWSAFAIAMIVGVLGGLLNGFLVAHVGLPSIAVTIGTLTLYRGIAEILLGSDTIPGIGDRLFPQSLTKIGIQTAGGTNLSYSMVIFLVLALVFAVVLHATPIGRSMFAIGLQPEAAQFAGIRIKRIKIAIFTLSGLLSAFAGILLTLQNSSVSYTAGIGLELNVVAIVLFGGVSIFGGRGTILGVVLSVAIFGSLKMALTQMNVQAEVQNIITGLLLLLSVILPNGGDAFRRLRTASRRSRPPR